MDLNFWGPMFGFLTALLGSIRWLIRVVFVYRQKINIQKAKLDSSVEELKRQNTVKMLSILKSAIDEMKPVLQEHSKMLDGFRNSFDLMQSIEQSATSMMADLKKQYSTFNEQVTKFNRMGDVMISRIDKIETEIIQMKSGLIFVKTKKD